MLKLFNSQKRSVRKFFHFSFSSGKNPKNPKINRTFYDILGVNSQATQQEIRESYLKLAKSHHPDTPTPHPKEVFHEINTAYQTLNDPKKRKEYDDSLISDAEYFKIKFLGMGFDLRILFLATLGIFIVSKGYPYYSQKYSKKCPLNHEQKKKTEELQKEMINSKGN